MEIKIDILTWLISALPIIVLLILMVRFHWGAADATPIALFISLVSGIIYFKAPIDLIAVESSKGIWNSLIVLIVIWPAILIYEVTREAGAFNTFRIGMKKFTPNELLRIISIGWIFVSFLQGITGFGVPVAVGAPLLVGIGLKPVWAIIIPLIGHAWAGTFGTLAVAWKSLIMEVGITEDLLIINTALWAAGFLWVVNLVAGLGISWFYGKIPGLKKGLPAVLVLSTVQGGGQLIFTQINTTISAFLSSCLALGVVFLLGKTKLYNKSWKIEESPIMEDFKEFKKDESSNMSLVQAFFPYFMLTSITLFILLIKPINIFLDKFKLFLYFKETSTGLGFSNSQVEMYSPLSPFTHAGVFLLISALTGFIYFRKKGYIEKKRFRLIMKRTIEKTVPSTIAVVGLIIMSKIMSGTGQIDVLALGVANLMGKSYILVASTVGLLGSFMTSSNMASNILFGKFQLTTSEILNLDIQPILASQTAGGSIGTSISPGNVILGTTTAGILGSEGKVLRIILPIALILSLMIGIFVYFYFIFF